MSLFFPAFGPFWSEIEDIYFSGDIVHPLIAALLMCYPEGSPLGDRSACQAMIAWLFVEQTQAYLHLHAFDHLRGFSTHS